MKRLFVESLLFVVALLPVSVTIRGIILASSVVAWSLCKCLEAYKTHIITQERTRATSTEDNIIHFDSKVR